MLAAGMEGIEKEYELAEPIERNVYEMSEEERKELGIATLPSSLYEAIELAENSELVKKALGDHIFEKFIENKKIEWNKYRIQITQYELDKYLPIL
jgi:glutamine synthetase